MDAGPKRNSLLHEVDRLGWIGHREWFETIDSTNLAAKRWLTERDSRAPKLPSVFVSNEQTLGRGRGGNQWWSPAGCLMMTLVIPSSVLPPNVEQWNQLALVVGVALADVAEQNTSPQTMVQLKWPNDLYVDGKKCGGILIESHTCSSSHSGREQSWLIGIGTNVTVNLEEAPPNVANRATTLSLHQPPAGQSVSVEQVFLDLLSSLRHWILGWGHGKLSWHDPWGKRCLLHGKNVWVRVPGAHEVRGVCDGVDSTGRLIVRHNAGVALITSGEIIRWESFST
jgi:BirA family biotin operon repressor/biotin-[acetyl-CoA-carboxylase] ligase